MKKLTQWIVARFIRDYEKTDNLKVRSRYGALEGWTSIAVNIVLFLIKGGIGLMIGSIALIADAVHTIGDCVTSIVVVVAFRICKKPSDKEHPFGHGRMESIAAIIVAVLLIVIGFEFLRSSVERLAHPTHVKAGFVVTAVLVATLVVKEMLSQFARHLAVMIDSKTLEADFWHHRTDVIATGLVIAALVASDLGFPRLDGIGGILVSTIVMYTGYEIAKEAISPLLGAAPTPEFLKEIEATAMSVDGVEGIHDVVVHQYGLTALVSLHIEVSDEKHPATLHEISEKVEAAVGHNVQGAVVVHVDPLNRNHEQYQEIQSGVAQIVSQDKRLISFHDLRIVGRGKAANVVFDIAIESDADEQEIYDIKALLVQRFKERFPDLGVVVKIEPKYAYNM